MIEPISDDGLMDASASRPPMLSELISQLVELNTDLENSKLPLLDLLEEFDKRYLLISQQLELETKANSIDEVNLRKLMEALAKIVSTFAVVARKLKTQREDLANITPETTAILFGRDKGFDEA